LAAQAKKEPDVDETITYENSRRELAHRASNGIDVTLYWGPSHDDVVVEVTDHSSQQAFEVSVARDRALDAFHHPYAYASRRGIDYEALLPQAT
jgi:hypothetical protein